MRKIALAAGLLLSGVAYSSTAQAADPYAWCAEYAGGGFGGGGTNCYFVTHAQCQAALTGGGSDFCRPNPFYTGRVSNPEGRRVRRAQ